jgi:hypothetical protein
MKKWILALVFLAAPAMAQQLLQNTESTEIQIAELAKKHLQANYVEILVGKIAYSDTCSSIALDGTNLPNT